MNSSQELLYTMLQGAAPRRLLHVGASFGQEMGKYRAANIQEVVWIDALPQCVCALQKRVNRLGLASRHTVLEGLVSARGGQSVTFHVASNRGQSSSMYEPKLHLEEFPHVRFPRTVTKQTTTLDQLFDDHQVSAAFDAIVLDLQGAELPALRGLSPEYLQQTTVLYTEVSYKEYYANGTCGLELREFLEDREFELWKQTTEEGHGNALYLRSQYQDEFEKHLGIRHRWGSNNPSQGDSFHGT